MSISDDNWFEVWYVHGDEIVPAYLVVVTQNPNSLGKISVLDITQNKLLYQGDSYEDVYLWLTEDDFDLVAGREF